MTEDRRILKTKRNLKATMIDLLGELPFEKITVAELCRRGETSRITFYAHYSDKYELADELFSDYIREAWADYHDLQRENNPENLGMQGYENLLECILRLIFRNFSFFSHVSPGENPYLFSVFFRHVQEQVAEYMQRHTGLKCRYPVETVSALLCNGLLGVIDVLLAQKATPEAASELVRGMYQNLLHSKLFQAAPDWGRNG